MSLISGSRLVLSISLFILSITSHAFLPRPRLDNVKRAQQNALSMDLKASTNTDSSITEASVHCYDESYALYLRLRACQNKSLATAIQSSLDALSDALRLYGPDRLISSFNGGKDAVVVMHLLRAALAKYTHDYNSTVATKNASSDGVSRIIQPQFIYFAIKDEFPEVLSFIDECEKKYGLNLIRYDCGIMQVTLRIDFIVLCSRY